MKYIFLLAIFNLAFLFAGDLDNFFSQGEKFSHAQVGIYVLEVESGKAIYQRQGEKFFVPASVMKIPITAASLNFLGEEFRFTTTLEYEGEVREKELLGNLWVRGGGDPTLMISHLEEWKERLSEYGIEKIQGKVFLDASHFEKAAASPFWNFEDLGNYYGAGATGLAINENQYAIYFQPGKEVGEAAKVVSIEPSLPDLIFHNEVVTAEAGSGDQVTVFGMEYSPLQYYRGSVPKGEELFKVKGSFPDPRLVIKASLEKILAPQGGVEIKEERKAPTQLIYTHFSAPLKEIVREMNRRSMNLYAEHLLKQLGEGGALQGRKKMEAFLASFGIKAQIKDGAGTARANLITPQGVVKLLVGMPTLENFLPQIEKEGALIKAKSGSMSNICNLAGYITLFSGKKYAFALFCNNYAAPLKEIREEISRFLDSLISELSGDGGHGIPSGQEIHPELPDHSAA